MNTSGCASFSGARRIRNFKALPIVDVSGLFSPDLACRLATAREMGVAAREVGFFYAVGHGVGKDLTDGLTACARRFFAQPLETKMRHYIGNSSNHSGYVPAGEEQFEGALPDTKECYDLGFELTDPTFARAMLNANQWPDWPGFRTEVEAYYQAAFEFGRVLFGGFALALGLQEEDFRKRVNRPPSQLRLIHYPARAGQLDDAPGIGAHTDYECFTLLLPTTDGLEVLNDRGEWIDAPVVPGAFVVNIGDMLEVLSNGQMLATTHRVRKVSAERYAFPLFFAMDYDTVVAPVPGLTPGVPGRQYAPLRCGDHIHAQTLRTFAYQKARLARGEVVLPDDSTPLASFGRKPVDGL